MVRIPLGDDTTLEGLLELPRGVVLRGADAVLICHPHPAFGGRMTTPIVAELAEAFVAAGLPVLRFHFRGIEGSDGEATGGLVEEADVLAATGWLESQGAARVAYVGYSFGALMSWKAIAAGARPPAYVGIALLTSIIGDDPARVADVQRVLASGVPMLLVSGDGDPLCDAAVLRTWTAGFPAVRVETLAGEAHVYSYTGQRRIVTLALAWVRAKLAA